LPSIVAHHRSYQICRGIQLRVLLVFLPPSRCSRNSGGGGGSSKRIVNNNGVVAILARTIVATNKNSDLALNGGKYRAAQAEN